MMKKLMIGVAAAALLSVPVLAFQAGHEGHDGMMKGMGMGSPEPVTRADVEAKVKERFVAADANKDGFLTQAEMDAAKANHMAERDAMMKQRMDDHFAKMDADKNGSISRAEFDAEHARKMADHDDMDGNGHRGMMGDEKGGRMHGGHHGMKGMGGKAMGVKMMSVEMLDTNKDGKVSLAEAGAMPLAHFDAADTNKDGSVTPDEHQAMRAKMHADWQAKNAAADAAAAAAADAVAPAK